MAKYRTILAFSLLFAHIVSAKPRSASLCRGGSGRYETNVNPSLGDERSALYARDCLISAFQKFKARKVCSQAKAGSCFCTVDSSSSSSKHRLAFFQAIDQMQEHTDNFLSLAAETYEGDLYINYLCSTARQSPKKSDKRLSEQTLNSNSKTTKRLVGNFPMLYNLETITLSP